MAEEIKDEQVQEQAEELQSEEPKTDWKSEARKWEKRAKEHAEKSRKYDELQDANKSELDKLKEEKSKLEQELNGIKSERELNELKQKVSKEVGVPVDLIKGATEDEMREFAEKLKEYATPKVSAHVPKNAKFDGRSPEDDKRWLAKELRKQ